MSENEFLPKGSDPISSGSRFYFRPPEGESRVRVLAPPIVGWIGWTAQRTPLRRPVDPDNPQVATVLPAEVVIDDRNKIRKFWAMPVWDYADRRVKIWELSQSTIQTPITNLVKDKDWGDPRRYDLKITRVTEGERTSYTVMPAPKKNPESEVIAAWNEVKAAGFDLGRLFAGGDPFRAPDKRPTTQSPFSADETYFNDPIRNPGPPQVDDEIPF